ncbi:MAG: helix-turn-helix transcriptional regulator [Williamsia sp.]|nr:helix-turn-helix transcriptional regulator [Williamsia sp.]
MQLYIKNMVCNRCILAVKALLEKLGIAWEAVRLGEVDLKENLLPEKEQQLRVGLEQLGFELLDDARNKLIERIKTLIIEQVHYGMDDKGLTISSLLSAALHKDYSYLSNLFSEVEGTTIEKYFISQKIERVKELLAYDEQSLSEIAYKMGYSSVAHLSAQFKKVTGLTPSYFRQRGGPRKTLDSV